MASKLIKALDRSRARFVFLLSIFLTFYTYQCVIVWWNLKQPVGMSIKEISRITFALESLSIVLLISVFLSYAVSLISERYLRNKLISKVQFLFRIHRYIYAVFILTFIFLVAKFNYHNLIVEKVNLGSGEIPKANETKVVLLGLDSASWRVLTPLIREGKLSKIEKMLEGSVKGNIITYGQAITPSVWTSIATGKTSDKHKITSFTTHEAGMESSIPVQSDHRQSKAIWNILSNLEYGVGLIDYIVTYPPEVVYGYNITNLFWRGYSHNVYPEELIPIVKRIVKRTVSKPSNIDPRLNRLHRKIDVLMNLFNALYKPEHKLTVVYTHTTDYISHRFWCYFDPENFRDPIWGLSKEKIEKYKNVIGEHWERVDRLVGDILEKLDENTIFIIVSDHGSRPRTTPLIYYLNLNKLLGELGFLNFDENDKIDFAKTVVYTPSGTDLSFPFVGININLKDREKDGIVSQEDRGYYEDKITDTLRNLKLDGSEERIFRKVSLFKDEEDSKARDVFSTSDIIVHFSRLVREYENDRSIDLNGRKFDINSFLRINKELSGGHSQRGVVILKGRNIRSNYLLVPRTIDTPITEALRFVNGRVKFVEPLVNFFRFLGVMQRATTLDITPTILYLMGLPIGRDMDGEVIVDAIAPKFLKENPILYIDTYENIGKRRFIDKNEKVDKEYLEYLKSLGYIN